MLAQQKEQRQHMRARVGQAQSDALSQMWSDRAKASHKARQMVTLDIELLGKQAAQHDHAVRAVLPLVLVVDNAQGIDH